MDRVIGYRQKVGGKRPVSNSGHIYTRATKGAAGAEHSAPAKTTPETMLCRTRHMLSSAYSPRTRRPLDPRPQQECVAGAEGPPIKRHESVIVEREEGVVLPSESVLSSPPAVQAPPDQPRVHASPAALRRARGALHQTARTLSACFGAVADR